MTLRQFFLFLISASAIAFASASQALLPVQRAEVKDFPSSVGVVFVSNLSKCTATKIAPKMFLTAAHCFDTFQRGSDVSIEQVSNNRLVLQKRTQIAQLRRHFFYPTDHKFEKLVDTVLALLPDVAIFKTVDDIDVPVAKMNFDRVHLAQDILVGGYGAQGKDICYPVLHTCSLNMADQKIRLIKGYFFYTVPNEAYPHYLTQGDSGGAAYIRDQNGNLEVVGVNSMMTPASAKQLFDMIVTQNQRANPSRTASIYIRLSETEVWINATVKELSKR